MGTQMGVHEAQGAIKEAKAHANTTLVAHHAHDTDALSHGGRVGDMDAQLLAHKDAQQHADQLAREDHGVAGSAAVEGAVDGLFPQRGARGVVEQQGVGAEVKFLETDGVDVSHLFASRAGQQPRIERFLGRLAVDVPGAHKDDKVLALHVLRFPLLQLFLQPASLGSCKVGWVELRVRFASIASRVTAFTAVRRRPRQPF